MKKRFQVFISSTLLDLREERLEVANALLLSRCIPAGMEQFPAVNDEQFEYIKDEISNSDYFFLILAGRYGSVSKKTGKSFTEMEYDFAASQGIPMAIFMHSDIENLPLKKHEESREGRARIGEFRDKVRENRMLRYFSHPKELGQYVMQSINELSVRDPMPGWIRGTAAESEPFKKSSTPVSPKTGIIGKEFISGVFGNDVDSRVLREVEDQIFSNPFLRLHHERSIHISVDPSNSSERVILDCQQKTTLKNVSDADRPHQLSFFLPYGEERHKNVNSVTSIAVRSVDGGPLFPIEYEEKHGVYSLPSSEMSDFWGVSEAGEEIVFRSPQVFMPSESTIEYSMKYRISKLLNDTEVMTFLSTTMEGSISVSTDIANLRISAVSLSRQNLEFDAHSFSTSPPKKSWRFNRPTLPGQGYAVFWNVIPS